MKRFNIELKEILNDVENIDINRFPAINIAYTHKTRKDVNKKLNDKLNLITHFIFQLLRMIKNTDKICIYIQVVL
jgi:hypothetical protein